METPLAGDAFLILASDGVLHAASPQEVCGAADAISHASPLPMSAAAAPAAIPLGPSDGSAGLRGHAAMTPTTHTMTATGTPLSSLNLRTYAASHMNEQWCWHVFNLL